MTHLDRLESQSIYILREAFSSFQSLAMLWSAGKDSNVILWLARKAFLGHVPFPMVYIDTGYEMPELLAFRDKLVRDWKLNLLISQNVQAFQEGQTFPAGKLTRVQCCGVLKKEALKQTLDRHRFQGLIVGVRRDEEPTRAKERVFSPRTATMQWEIEDQPPEFGTNSIPRWQRELISESIHCSIGRNLISGNIRSRRGSLSRNCILTTEPANAIARWAAIPAPAVLSRPRKASRKLLRNCKKAASLSVPGELTTTNRKTRLKS